MFEILGPPLQKLLETTAGPWKFPIVLYGAEPWADIEAVNKSVPKNTEIKIISSVRDLPGLIRRSYDQTRIVRDLFEDARRISQARTGETESDFFAASTAPANLGHLRRLLTASYGEFEGRMAYENLVDDIESLIKSNTVATQWSRSDTFPVMVASVWRLKARRNPLILLANNRIKADAGRWHNVPSSQIDFRAMTECIQAFSNVSFDDVEKAYRVWQLSKESTHSEEKKVATTPRHISLSNANRFLSVFSRSHVPVAESIGLNQNAAPAMFEIANEVIVLKAKTESLESSLVTIAGASTLRRQFDQILADGNLRNTVPSADLTITSVMEALDRLIIGDYNDGVVVGLGLEINGLQWCIDGVSKNIHESTLAELTAIYSNAHIFLRRYPIWVEYMATSNGSVSDDLDKVFLVARNLLEDARPTRHILGIEAGRRVDEILSRTPDVSSPPALKEGLVRTSENLAAVTLGDVATQVGSAAKGLGGDLLREGKSQAAKEIVKYVSDNLVSLSILGRLRHLPWVTWLSNL